MYKNHIKRILDLVVSLFFFIALLPLFLLLIIILLINNRSSPFFFQTRPGRNLKLFKVIKFKTMTDATDKEGNLLPDSARLTAIGGFIRKTSMDEIPQFLNVIKGDMSLIGPRPLLTEYIPLYSQRQLRRHEVRPGITGWAQINGRNLISWTEKFENDLWYIDHLSFALDCKIILKTLDKVFKAEGISSTSNVTVEKFSGQN